MCTIGKGSKWGSSLAFVLVFGAVSTIFAASIPELTVQTGVIDSAPQISIRLDPGDKEGIDADWWLLAETPYGWHHYHLSGTWEPGIAPTYQGPITGLDSYVVSLGPDGVHTIYFGVDTSADGNLDLENLEYDHVRVGGQGALVSAISIANQMEADIEPFLDANDYPSESSHSVEIFRVSYLTADSFGAAITASGLLLLPVGLTSPAPLLAAHHGTLVMGDDAPSLRPNVGFVEGLLFASAGYVTILPDYIGFGDSANEFRPYLHAESYATAVLDLVRAVKDLCTVKNVPLSGKLFLMGYSEGGYATMAVQRSIELNHQSEFHVTASAPTAGPYNLSRTLRESLAREEKSVLFPVIMCLYSLDRIYGLKILEQIFQPQALVLINAGLANPSVIEELAGMDYAGIFWPGFLSSYLGDGEILLKEATGKNDLGDWKPAAPVRLFHCVNDDIVPFFNSVELYESFLSQGAENVTLEARDYGNHAGCYPKTVLEVKVWFDSLKVN